jgi:chromosome partitioning protein
MTYSIQKIINLFGMTVARNAVIQAEKAGTIPLSSRELRGSIRARAWPTRDLPLIGERWGFLQPLAKPTAMAVFSTKGGVLKTTLALNIARIAALHNIKTCVVGLDIQGDITKTLGFFPEIDEDSDLSTAIAEMNSVPSLVDYFQEKVSLEDLVFPLEDLPTLSLIPESSGLAALDVGLTPKARREYWLRDNVITPLKKKFDLIVMDCSPSWSQITSNALVACDVLVSPLETKINHYRNYDDFVRFLSEFEKIMDLKYQKIAVPTRFSSTRKLCVEIRNYYLAHAKGCTSGVVREAITGEEAMGAYLSLIEYAPTSVAANEMRDLVQEIWSRLSLAENRPYSMRPEIAASLGV